MAFRLNTFFHRCHSTHEVNKKGGERMNGKKRNQYPNRWLRYWKMRKLARMNFTKDERQSGVAILSNLLIQKKKGGENA